jgi:predicted nuclease of predicted toxin-antitoxin system
MNLLADESVDRQIVNRLRLDGHTIWYVTEMEPGIPDEGVLDLANREGAVLLTADKDFGELVFRQRRLTLGVVLIRLAGLSPDHKAEVVASVIAQRAGQLRHAFAVITPGIVRLRRRAGV